MLGYFLQKLFGSPSDQLRSERDRVFHNLVADIGHDDEWCRQIGVRDYLTLFPEDMRLIHSEARRLLDKDYETYRRRYVPQTKA